jgi:hypothetical protein
MVAHFDIRTYSGQIRNTVDIAWSSAPPLVAACFGLGQHPLVPIRNHASNIAKRNKQGGVSLCDYVLYRSCWCGTCSCSVLGARCSVHGLSTSKEMYENPVYFNLYDGLPVTVVYALWSCSHIELSFAASLPRCTRSYAICMHPLACRVGLTTEWEWKRLAYEENNRLHSASL